VTHHPSPDQMRLSRRVGQLGSLALAAVSGFAVAVSTFAVESFSPARLGAVMGVLFSMHLLRYRRFLFTREFALYVLLVCYMAIELFWTEDLKLAMNALTPAVTLAVILLHFGSLATDHDVHTVLLGTLGGLVTGAALFTAISGFPFVYPADFSYNATAGMYLLGLFVALTLSCYMRSRIPALALGAILLLLIVATTSIKTNLGILLGAATAGLVYAGRFVKALPRAAVPLIALAVIGLFAVSSNEVLVERLQRGVGRIALGIEVLQSRDDVAGYSGTNSRQQWMRTGLAGWVENPLFGHGVEGFRNRFGITSHSTPVDLLYNSGLIGFGLFYGIFASMAWRLYRMRHRVPRDAIAVILGGLVCYMFMSLTGTLYYSASLAVFVAISTALLCQPGKTRHLVASWPTPS